MVSQINKPNTWWWIEILRDSSKYNNKQNLFSERISCYPKISAWFNHKAFHNSHNAKFWSCLRGDDRTDKIWRKQHFLTHCCYYLQAQNISSKIATIVVRVWTIIADRIATNCVWDCNNCVFCDNCGHIMALRQKWPKNENGLRTLFLALALLKYIYRIWLKSSSEKYQEIQAMRHTTIIIYLWCKW